MPENKASSLRIIAGKWRGRKINFQEQEGLRPTPDRVRETLFNWLTADLPNSVCLDLFAGSGALGFEAASRGAQSVVMVEDSKKICQVIQENITQLKFESIKAVTMDALEYLEKNTTNYSVVFLDPPYKADILPKIFKLLEQKHCLAEHAKIYVEHDTKQALPPLPNNWCVLKNKTAGQVSYCLIERKPLLENK